MTEREVVRVEAQNCGQWWAWELAVSGYWVCGTVALDMGMKKNVIKTQRQMY